MTIAGLPNAPWTSLGRTAPLTSSTAAPASATTSERIRSQISTATTTARTREGDGLVETHRALTTGREKSIGERRVEAVGLAHERGPGEQIGGHLEADAALLAGEFGGALRGAAERSPADSAMICAWHARSMK